MSVHNLLSNANNNSRIVIGSAVAIAVGILTKMFWKKWFGGEEESKFPTALVDRNTKVSFKLIKKTEISHDTRLFRFALPSDEHVLGLPVGNHISLSARIDGKLTIRSYTPVSSNRDQGYVELIIKVYFPNVHPKFPDGGKMTMHLEKLEIGDEVDFAGPKGFIEYKPPGLAQSRTAQAGTLNIKKDKKFDTEPEVIAVRKIGMVAGGSGITPMLQIMREVAYNQPNDNTHISLLYANQTEEDILCRDEIESLVANSDGKFKVHYTLDRPPAGWKHSSGFITEEMLEKTMPAYGIPTPGTTPFILICGPPPMIKFACLPNLEKMGWESDHIYCY